MDNMGMYWETSHGTFELDMQTIKWITDNAKMSMYNDKRSYVYNKAFSEFLYKVELHNKPLNLIGGLTMPDYDKSQMMFNKIRTWIAFYIILCSNYWFYSINILFCNMSFIWPWMNSNSIRPKILAINGCFKHWRRSSPSSISDSCYLIYIYTELCHIIKQK